MTGKGFQAGFPAETVREGRVNVLVPKLEAFKKQSSDYAPSKAPVFYNPVMELNRDIAVLAVQVHQRLTGKEITVCEPLTGCGLRGIRFAAEVNHVKKVVLSDISTRACELAQHNVDINGLSKRVNVENVEAHRVLAKHNAPRKRFDVIDIDPFGSPVPYLDSALRALRGRGFIALTATDMAPLCGVHAKACIRKYGGKPLRTEYCHELAVRLLCGCLALTAAKQDIGIDVVFSHRAEHYIRVYGVMGHGSKCADESLENMGHIFHCFKCSHREITKGLFTDRDLRTCPECEGKLERAGPLWVGGLAQPDFLALMEEEASRRPFRLSTKIQKMFSLVRGEIDAPPTYYVVDRLCDALALPVLSVRKMMQRLGEEGFKAVPTHFNSRGIRSDAPSAKVTQILRESAGR